MTNTSSNGSNAAAALDEPTKSTNDSETRQKPAKKSKKQKKSGFTVGSPKGVETMYRNACRAELDMIALAATKANIMISLNGLIISALIISGAFIFASSPRFLFPAGVFLITAAISITFALLAASPQQMGLFSAFYRWSKSALRRDAGLRDLKTYLNEARAEDVPPQVNPLIAENRAHISEDEYWEVMQRVMSGTEVYRAMSDQIYWLGEMATRKMRLLDISYTVFRWGLFLTVCVFLIATLIVNVLPGTATGTSIAIRSQSIGTLTDIYEPSALQQLPDGRILVVEDEVDRAFSLVTINPDGSLVENPVMDERLMRGFGRRLADLEGLSIDNAGQIYATTSHSRKNNDQRDADREQLLRFEIGNTRVGKLQVYSDLRDALTGSSQLQDAIKAFGGDPDDLEDLNIEGLAFVPRTGQLLLGLRAPMVADSALLIGITNPDAVFDDGATPEFSDPILLGLADGGIRALSFDPVLGAFLIVNEIERPEGDKVSQLWIWYGQARSAARPLSLPGIINMNNVESIDSVLVEDRPMLLLMSDEGDPSEDRPARYFLLDYDMIGN